MKQIIESLQKINSIKFGDFILKSGQSSKVYLDLRQIISYPDILREVSSIIWEKISHLQFDVICGVPYTALPIATCISLQHNIPMIMRRKEPKAYGTKKQIEGAFHAGQRCLIVVDVVTTGASILETVNDLRAEGLIIADVASLVNREQGGKENLANNNLQLVSALTLNEILAETPQ